MTFESEGFLIVAIYKWLPPASFVVFSDNSGWKLKPTNLYPRNYIPTNVLIFMNPRKLGPTKINDFTVYIKAGPLRFKQLTNLH